MYSFEAANTCSELYHKATSIFSIFYSFDSNLINTVITYLYVIRTVLHV